MKKYILFIISVFILLAMSATLIFIAPNYPLAVEAIYAQRIFSAYNAPITALAGIFPFSVAEVFVAITLIVVIFCTFCVVHLALKKQWAAMGAVLLTIAFIGGGLYTSFYNTWGFSYYRLPLSYTLGLEQSDRDPNALLDLCIELRDFADIERQNLEKNADGTVKFKTATQTSKKVRAAYENLYKIMPISKDLPSRAKTLAISPIMNYLGISGIYIPFTREANVNGAEHPMGTGLTVMHEAAHLLGIAREDEANFIGFLAGCSSDDKYIRYSSLMMALIYTGNAVNDLSNDVYYALRDTYSAGMEADLQAYSKFWDQYKGEIQEKATQVNNNYLQSHGQEQGVLSYGMMVDLLLDAHAAGWLDVFIR